MRCIALAAYRTIFARPVVKMVIKHGNVACYVQNTPIDSDHISTRTFFPSWDRPHCAKATDFHSMRPDRNILLQT